MINRLFDEKFIRKDVDIQYENPEFIQDDYGRITEDMFISIRKDRKVYRYHIELQTFNLGCNHANKMEQHENDTS